MTENDEGEAVIVRNAGWAIMILVFCTSIDIERRGNGVQWGRTAVIICRFSSLTGGVTGMSMNMALHE